MNKLILAIMLAFMFTGISYADDDKTNKYDKSWHLELVANSSVFMLEGADTYNGLLITPEARLRKGLGDGHSAYIAAGLGAFAQLTDEQDDTATIQRNNDTAYTATLGYAYEMDDDDNPVTFGFDHVVAGIGYGNFSTNEVLNLFDDGMFIYLGFTVNAMGIRFK